MLRVHAAILLVVASPSITLAATATLNYVQLSPGIIQVEAWVDPDNGDVTGIAGFDFEVVGTRAADISWHPATLAAYDHARGKQVGFTFMLSGVIGNATSSLRYSVGAVQNPTDLSSNVHGIGIHAVNVPGTSSPFEIDNVAVLGTITGPEDLGYMHLDGPQGVLLFPSGGGNPIAPTRFEVLYNGEPFPTGRDLRPAPVDPPPIAPVAPPTIPPESPEIVEPEAPIDESPNDLPSGPVDPQPPLPVQPEPRPLPVRVAPIPPLSPGDHWFELTGVVLDWDGASIDSTDWIAGSDSLHHLRTTSAGPVAFGDFGTVMNGLRGNPAGGSNEALGIQVPEPSAVATGSLVVVFFACRLRRQKR